MYLKALQKTSPTFADVFKLTRNGIISSSFHVSSKTTTKSSTPASGCYSDPKCKVALITGATGIGYACAHQLLAQDARAVAILGLDPKEGEKSAASLNNSFGRGKALFIHSNVNCMTQFEDTFKEVQSKFGNIDMVVNAAGILDGHNWEKEVVTNLIGTIRGTLLGYKYMSPVEKIGKGGVVVNIAGVTGLEPLYSAPTLSAEHHAIVGLTRSFGCKHHTEKTGVRVVCVCPGFTATSFLERVRDKAMCPEWGKELEKHIAKTQKQKPKSIGQAVCHVIKYGPPGSIWVVEGNQLYQTDLPQRDSYMKLAAQYF